eukprot:29940-Eustigmatos_ZCMA.PRE.1
MLTAVVAPAQASRFCLDCPEVFRYVSSCRRHFASALIPGTVHASTELLHTHTTRGRSTPLQANGRLLRATAST